MRDVRLTNVTDARRYLLTLDFVLVIGNTLLSVGVTSEAANRLSVSPSSLPRISPCDVTFTNFGSLLFKLEIFLFGESRFLVKGSCFLFTGYLTATFKATTTASSDVADDHVTREGIKRNKTLAFKGTYMYILRHQGRRRLLLDLVRAEEPRSSAESAGRRWRHADTAAAVA